MKCDEIPILKNKISQLMTDYENLKMINEVNEPRVKKFLEDNSDKIDQLDNLLRLLKGKINDKIDGDKLHLLQNKDLDNFIEFINNLLNNPYDQPEIEFKTFPSPSSDDKQQKSPLKQSQLQIDDPVQLLDSQVNIKQQERPQTPPVQKAKKIMPWSNQKEIEEKKQEPKQQQQLQKSDENTLVDQNYLNNNYNKDQLIRLTKIFNIHNDLPRKQNKNDLIEALKPLILNKFSRLQINTALGYSVNQKNEEIRKYLGL